MHALTSSFVLAYHGCDAEDAEKLVAGQDFKPSQNEYDWLGPGIYFWEANPKRGLEFARELMRNPRGHSPIRKPAVIGAIVELGMCLDLTTTAGIQQVQSAYEHLHEITTAAGLDLPTNSKDLLRRNLDCAVIRTLHDVREEAALTPVDTVKGVFVEGSPIYPNAGIASKTHIQICVCNHDKIKGVFRVPKRFLA